MNKSAFLAQQRLLKKMQPPDEPLRVLCHHGYLMGGLSIELDVKLDEALGPLLEVMGGPARTMKVLDIQGRVFSVRIGRQLHEWEVDSLESLVDTLNVAFEREPEVKGLVFLGEWEDAQQVWAVSKNVLTELVKHPWFPPSRRGEG